MKNTEQELRARIFDLEAALATAKNLSMRNNGAGGDAMSSDEEILRARRAAARQCGEHGSEAVISAGLQRLLIFGVFILAISAAIFGVFFWLA